MPPATLSAEARVCTNPKPNPIVSSLVFISAVGAARDLAAKRGAWLASRKFKFRKAILLGRGDWMNDTLCHICDYDLERVYVENHDCHTENRCVAGRIARVLWPKILCELVAIEAPGDVMVQMLIVGTPAMIYAIARAVRSRPSQPMDIWDNRLNPGDGFEISLCDFFPEIKPLPLLSDLE